MLDLIEDNDYGRRWYGAVDCTYERLVASNIAEQLQTSVTFTDSAENQAARTD